MSNETDTKKPEQSELIEAYRLALQSQDFPVRQFDQWLFMFQQGVRFAYQDARKMIEETLK